MIKQLQKNIELLNGLQNKIIKSSNYASKHKYKYMLYQSRQNLVSEFYKKDSSINNEIRIVLEQEAIFYIKFLEKVLINNNPRSEEFDEYLNQILQTYTDSQFMDINNNIHKQCNNTITRVIHILSQSNNILDTYKVQKASHTQQLINQLFQNKPKNTNQSLVK